MTDSTISISAEEPSKTITTTEDPMKSAATGETSGSKSEPTKTHSTGINPYEVRYGSQSLGTPAFTNLLNQVTSIKLDRTNFLLWQNIVLPILKSYKLEGHLSGKTPAPDMTIIVPPSKEDPLGLKIPNPEYDLWLAADQLLVGWLYNSMTPEIATQVMGHEEAKNLWDSIQEYYGVQSRSQEDYNRLMLQQTRKGTMKMYEYLETMKKYFDNLLIAGFPMDMRSFISHVTAGLDEEYTPIVCVIRNQNMTWSEIQLELLSFEQRQERLQALKTNISVNQASANLAEVLLTSGDTQKSHYQTNNQQNKNFSSNFSNQNRGHFSNRGNRYRSRGRYSPYPQNNRPICQLCGKMGHTAVICHHRYDKPETPAHHSPNTVSSNHGNKDSNPNNATALMAYPETLQDPSWYLDSGATNHVTGELGKLSLKGKEIQ